MARRIPLPADPSTAISGLFLGDYPALLTLEQVAEACGRRYSWAYEKARRGELPIRKDGKTRMLVAKLELIAWLAGPHAEVLFRALATATPAHPAVADPTPQTTATVPVQPPKHSERDRLEFLKREFPTPVEWTLDDYRDFYQRDVSLLLRLVQRLAEQHDPDFPKKIGPDLPGS